MIPVSPSVRLIARPQIDWLAIEDYLGEIGGLAWAERVRPLVESGDMDPGEALIEFAARECYKAFDVGINANVARVRKDSEAYFLNILNQGHGSVLENAFYVFHLKDVSRVLTHEWVRHRVGVSISQESLRYVRLDNLRMWLPPTLTECPEGVDADDHALFIMKMEGLIEQMEEWQVRAAKHYGLDNEGVDFAYKKKITSAMRRLAPMGLATSMVWGANVRTLRHVIGMRANSGAEEEAIIVADKIATIMGEQCPYVFHDAEYIGDGEWKFTSEYGGRT